MDHSIPGTSSAGTTARSSVCVKLLTTTTDMCSAAAAAETEKECFETFHNDPYHAITGTQKMVHLSFKDTTYPPPPPPVLLLDRLLLVLRGRHLPSFFCFTNSKTFRETKTEVCKCSADSGLRMPNSENLASASKIIIYAIPPFFNFKVIC